MFFLKKLLNILRLCTFWGVYFLSRFMPRNKKIKLYGGMGGFSNNSKYAFLFALYNNSDENYIYWVTHSKKDFIFLTEHGLPVLKKISIKGFWYCLRAKYYYFSWFVDDINFWTSNGAICTNFWHGLPIKKIQYDIYTGNLGRIFNPQSLKDKLYRLINIIHRPAFFKAPDFLYCPDKRFSKKFQSAFKINENQLIFKEYPRVEYLLTKNDIDFFDEITINILLDKKKIIYVPTFRDFDKDWFSIVFTDAKLLELNRILKEKNMLFYIKAHPNEKILLSSEYDCIINIDSHVDLYTLFRNVEFEVYITDYSSVFFEMTKLSDNIELFWPDHSDYLKYSRDWYFDLREYANKLPIYNIIDLYDKIVNQF